jgi:glucose-6-phosphate-specific signal transduction histidine kinase
MGAENKVEQRLAAELNVRNQLDQKFFNTKSIIRRSPDKYMHNPTKVFTTTINSK